MSIPFRAENTNITDIVGHAFLPVLSAHGSSEEQDNFHPAQTEYCGEPQPAQNLLRWFQSIILRASVNTPAVNASKLPVAVRGSEKVRVSPAFANDVAFNTSSIFFSSKSPTSTEKNGVPLRFAAAAWGSMNSDEGRALAEPSCGSFNPRNTMGGPRSLAASNTWTSSGATSLTSLSWPKNGSGPRKDLTPLVDR